MSQTRFRGNDVGFLSVETQNVPIMSYELSRMTRGTRVGDFKSSIEETILEHPLLRVPPRKIKVLVRITQDRITSFVSFTKVRSVGSFSSTKVFRKKDISSFSENFMNYLFLIRYLN